MGRNWPDYIVEAKRCLAKNGYLLLYLARILYVRKWTKSQQRISWLSLTIHTSIEYVYKGQVKRHWRRLALLQARCFTSFSPPLLASSLLLS